MHGISCREKDTGCNGALQATASNGGDPVPLPGTRVVLFPNQKNPAFVRLQVNCRWGLPKEDFLHYIATGHAGMGRRGQRSPGVAELHPAGAPRAGNRRTARGADIPEIRAVREVQIG